MNSTAKTILIVEDEAIIAMSERLALAEGGYDVEIAGSGEEALSYLDGGRVPDLILMDVDLGSGIDGTAAARAIRSRWELPIIFLTSRPLSEISEKARGVTRFGYIAKTSDAFAMLSMIASAFEQLSGRGARRKTSDPRDGGP